MPEYETFNRLGTNDGEPLVFSKLASTFGTKGEESSLVWCPYAVLMQLPMRGDITGTPLTT